MKTNLLYFSIFVVIAYTGSLRAQTVSGNQLEIGLSGANQVSGTLNSGAIGIFNNIQGDDAFGVGCGNYVWTRSLGVGYYNQQSGSDGMCVGSINTNDGGSCLLVGAYNYSQNDWELGAANHSLLVGTFNTAGISVSASFVLGTNNVVAGDYNYSMDDYETVDSSSTMGRGLVNKWSYSTVIGTYNDSTVADQLRFAVGNGIDATHRSNAFEVYVDGKIKMPRQGDILMGEFGE